MHDPEDNLFKRNVLPLLELESMKTLISQILNMAEIMGELNEYLHIGEGHEGNYPSIEEFKNDLDLEYIKKFMREVCEDLKIKQWNAYYLHGLLNNERFNIYYLWINSLLGLLQR